MKVNSEAAEEDKLPEEEVLAQMTCVSSPFGSSYFLRLQGHAGTGRTFLFAGTDTTSIALSRTLELLTRHQEVQNKLRAEIMRAKAACVNGEDIPYNTLVDLPYLDAVCRETMRL